MYTVEKFNKSLTINHIRGSAAKRTSIRSKRMIPVEQKHISACYTCRRRVLVLRTSGRSQHFWQRFKLKPMRRNTATGLLPAPKPMMRPAVPKLMMQLATPALQPALKPMRQPTCVASANADAAASAEAEAQPTLQLVSRHRHDDRAVITRLCRILR